jgi:hypothetical protein
MIAEINGASSIKARKWARQIDVAYIILPVLLWMSDWSFKLREEHRLRVFENRVLRRVFGPKRDEVTGEWIKLHNGELRIYNSSPDIITQIKSKRMR